MNKLLMATTLMLLAGATAAPVWAQDENRRGQRDGSGTELTEEEREERREARREERGERARNGSRGEGAVAPVAVAPAPRQAPQQRYAPQQPRYAPPAQTVGPAPRGDGRYDGRYDRDDRNDGRGDRDGRYDGRGDRDGRYDGRGDRDGRYDGRYDGRGDRDGRHDGGWDRDRDNDRNRHDRRWDPRWNIQFRDGRYYAPYRYRQTSRYNYPRGYGYYQWRPGHRLPPAFFGRGYYIDYRYYRLPPPPYGYQWVRIDNDVYLVALGSGLIRDILYGLFY